MGLRRALVKPSVVTVMILPVLSSCTSARTLHAAQASIPQQVSQQHRLSKSDIAKSVAVARREIADQDASVTSASATARPGTVRHSNTGEPCASGRLLKIKLIGKFPHIVISPIDTSGHLADSTVRAVIITADARTGRPCLVAVQAVAAAANPLPDATMIRVS